MLRVTARFDHAASAVPGVSFFYTHPFFFAIRSHGVLILLAWQEYCITIA